MTKHERIARFQALINRHLAIAKTSTSDHAFRAHVGAASRIVEKMQVLQGLRKKPGA